MSTDEIKLLDHGYLRFVESYGSDERIVEAARMSTGKGFLGWGHEECTFCGDRLVFPSRRPCPDSPNGNHDFKDKPGDEKLLRFLDENRHTSPFEMAGMIIEVQMPIFVFREWHRHRTQSFSEMSARYTPLPDFNYIPTVERLLIHSKTNKQAGTVAGAAALTPDGAAFYRGKLQAMYEDDERFYQETLAMGVPKELARVHLPVGRYSRMRASTNLHNWLYFLTLRQAPAAQWEIRQYANAVGTYIADRFPRTWECFVERTKRWQRFVEFTEKEKAAQ
jgi:thymidylate synthase (FAD)